MAIVSQQNWLIQKFIMEDIFKKLLKLSLNTPFYGIWFTNHYKTWLVNKPSIGCKSNGQRILTLNEVFQ